MLLILIFSMHIFTAVSGIITALKPFISPKMLNASVFQKYEFQKLLLFYLRLSLGRFKQNMIAVMKSDTKGNTQLRRVPELGLEEIGLSLKSQNCL